MPELNNFETQRTQLNESQRIEMNFSQTQSMHFVLYKVEFNQPSCWLYSVPNLFVIQQLVTLYLGGNHVRVVGERVKKCSSLCKVAGTRDQFSRVACGLQATRSCTHAKHVEKLKCHASQSTTGQKVQTGHSVSSRLSQVARPSRQPALFWKN